MNLNNFCYCSLILLVSTIFSIFSYAQNTTDVDKNVEELFIKYTNEINCEIQNALLESGNIDLEKFNCDLVKSNEIMKSLEDNNLDKNKDIHNAIIKKRDNLSSDIDLDDAETKINDFREFIFNKLPLLKKSSLYDTPKYEKLEIIIIPEISTEFIDTVNSLKNAESNANHLNHDKEEKNPDLSSNDESGPFLGIPIIPIILFLLVCVLIYLLYKKVNVIEAKRKRLRDDFQAYIDKVHHKSIRQKETGMSQNSSRLKYLEMVVGKLQDDIRNLVVSSNNKRDYSQQEPFSRIEGSNQERTAQSEQPIIESPKSEIYYLTDPDPSGFFWDDQKSSSFSPNQAAYQLEIDSNNPSFGKFSIISDESRHKALISSYDVLLEPACKILSSKDGTKITQVEPGKVALQGGKWQITKKCLIKIT